MEYDVISLEGKIIKMRLNRLHRIRLRIFGSSLIGTVIHNGWRTAMEVYIAVCDDHGLFLAYPSGYYRKLLCQKCIKTEVLV